MSRPRDPCAGNHWHSNGRLMYALPELVFTLKSCIYFTDLLRPVPPTHTHTPESPSPPLLTVEPVVDGTNVDVCWRAALNSGGLNDLHYNIYVHQIGVEGAMYMKVNDVGITGTGEICHPVPSSRLNPMSSYAILVTSANGATGDPETLDQSLTTVDGQYVAFFVDTGEPGENVPRT